MDGDTAQVLESFERAGVHALLLKGPSIACWLYDHATERPYFDCDLLVEPVDYDAAEQELRSLGYVPLLDRWGLPAWWYGHAVPWTHPGGRASVDLHRTLIGVGVDHATTWSVLSADADEILVGGHRASCLGLPARGRCTSPSTRPSTAPAASRPRTSSGRWPWATTSCGSGRRRSPVSSTRRRRSSRGCGSPRRVHGSPPAWLCLMLARSRPSCGRPRLPRSPSASSSWRGRPRCGRARRLCGATSRPSARLLMGSDPRAATGWRRPVWAYMRRLAWLARHAPRGFLVWYRVDRSVRHSRR